MKHPVQTACPLVFAWSLLSRLQERLRGNVFFFRSDAVSSLSRFEPYSLPLSSLAPRSSPSTRVQNIKTSLAGGSISSRHLSNNYINFILVTFSERKYLFRAPRLFYLLILPPPTHSSSNLPPPTSYTSSTYPSFLHLPTIT